MVGEHDHDIYAMKYTCQGYLIASIDTECAASPECCQVPAAHCTCELKVGSEGLTHAWGTELSTLRDLAQQQAHLQV
jgi:hypothetical protein